VEKMKRAYDKHHKASRKYNKGDLIWLEGKNIQTKRPMKKLNNKWYGPSKSKRYLKMAHTLLPTTPPKLANS
jgi:hypothetical protein